MSMVKKLLPIVDFLGTALGDNVEIVLHDLADPENSIIAIANGHISGRKIGGPLTDLVLKVMKEGLDKKTNFISNYTAKVKNNRSCRSSSFFIRDDEEKIVAVLCINVDVTKFSEARSLLDSLIGVQGGKIVPVETRNTEEVEVGDFLDVFENLHESIDDVLTAIIDKVFNEFPVPPDRLSLEEKIDVVKKLNEHGLFLLKGGLSELARRMNISEATIYRYLNKIK